MQGVAAGQAAVLYDGESVVLSGTILATGAEVVESGRMTPMV